MTVTKPLYDLPKPIAVLHPNILAQNHELIIEGPLKKSESGKSAMTYIALSF